MTVFRDDKVRLGGDCAIAEFIVVRVSRDHAQTKLWIDLANIPVKLREQLKQGREISWRSWATTPEVRTGSDCRPTSARFMNFSNVKQQRAEAVMGVQQYFFLGYCAGKKANDCYKQDEELIHGIDI